jgi:hypothetical protein
MKRLPAEIWRKTYVRSKAGRRREDSKHSPPVLAECDVLLAVGSVHNVRVTGPFEGREEWLVEKVVISMEDGNVVAAPTTIINVNHPYLPIANPSTRPWYIRAGDVVGKPRDSEEYADKPSTEEEYDKMAASAEALARVIQETLRAQDNPPPDNLSSEDHAGDESPEASAEDDDLCGPKTSALPDDSEHFTAEEITNVVNLGPDIPADIRPCLESLLRHHAAAFGGEG